jgi:hypothetical protein
MGVQADDNTNEEMGYCFLGILDVNMPLLYSER